MKTLLIVAAVLAVLLCLALAWMSWRAERPTLGLADGKLTPCVSHTNCVCSDYPGQATIAPLQTGGAAVPMEAIAAAVTEAGGVIETQGLDYLRAVFRSRLFRFADDVEFRLDTESGLIHVRSASRVGRSDLGVNRERVEKIRALVGE